jgi:hypothetical protein
MHRLASIVVAVVVAAAIAGCASSGSTVAPEAMARYQRIGVVSITAQRFTRQYVGFTVFGNELDKLDIASWDVDARYEQQVAQVLTTFGGFEVVPGTTARAALLRVNDLNGPWDAPAFRGPNWGAAANAIKDYCTANRLNAFVLAFAVDAPDYLGNTNQYLRGAGTYARGIGDSTRLSVLHLITGVALVDCATAKPAAVRGLANSQEGFPGQTLRASPLRPIPPELSRTPLDQLTDAQKTTLKDALVTLPEVAWLPTLRALFGK